MAKLLDIFACKECERAIFLNLEDRTADHFVCPHCQHDQSREEAMKSYEAELALQQEDSNPSNEDPHNYPDVLACDSCDQAIKLSVEEQSSDALNCPFCKTSLLPSNNDSEIVESKQDGDFPKDPQASSELKSAEEVDGAADSELPERLPDLISCNNCDRALFVSDEDRVVGAVHCSHCGHEHGSDALKQIAAAQASESVEESVAESVPEQAFPELLECPDCQRAIKLLPEQRDAESTICPYCEVSIAPPEQESFSEESATQVFDEPEKLEEDEETESVSDESATDSILFEDESSKAVGEEDESVSLFDDEGGQGDEATAETVEQGSDDVILFEDDTDVVEQTEETPEVDEENSRLLENMIETSRSQSLMPECFNCPKCETEIVLPEAERMMGLCFCPECEELIDSNTAQANVPEKPELDEDAEVEPSDSASEQEEQVAATETEVVDEEKEPEGQDVGAAMDDAASEMEFWLDEVLPEVVDCVKCGNSLKLDDEEKMFGIYRCPYCKANINHAKGEVVQSILGVMEDGEDDGDDDAPKRKPIRIDFKAVRPYAALLVFAAGLIFGVLKVSDYFYERKMIAAELVSKINELRVHMDGHKDIFGELLKYEKTKMMLAGLNDLSIPELRAYDKSVETDYHRVYEAWFEKEGGKVETVESQVNPETKKLVAQFRAEVEQLNTRLELAKMDAENLSTAMGLSKFERLEGMRLINGHVDKIKHSLSGISNNQAIRNGLVAPSLVETLQRTKSKVEAFEIHSEREAVRQFEKISKEASELAVYFPVGRVGAIDVGNVDVAKGAGLKKGSTPWNGEIQYWRRAKKNRDSSLAQSDWKQVAEEFRKLQNSLEQFHERLEKAVNSPPEEFSRFNHKFLDGGAFRSSLDAFQSLDGVRNRKFVKPEMHSRLEELAVELDPNHSGSLSHRIRVRQVSASRMTRDEVERFYEDFDKLWQPFLVDQQWFELEGLSSFYHLAKPQFTMMRRAPSAND